MFNKKKIKNQVSKLVSSKDAYPDLKHHEFESHLERRGFLCCLWKINKLESGQFIYLFEKI